MKPTYRIDTMGGVAARWLPSIDEAKARFTTQVMEGWQMFGEEHGEPTPVVVFEPSTESEDGEPRPEYIRCLVDGDWDASIAAERPAWPSQDFPYGDSPDLIMITNGSCLCRTPRLVCRDIVGDEFSEFARKPAIMCSGCGCVWEPEGDES